MITAVFCGDNDNELFVNLFHTETTTNWHFMYSIFYDYLLHPLHSLVETTLLRRHGYVFNLEYEKFLNRYKMLSNQTWPHWNGGGSVDGVTCLLRNMPISANEYAFGRTKIFIRTSKTVGINNNLHAFKPS